jgi:electron-transferring-flavoprotein dehydrogenase
VTAVTAAVTTLLLPPLSLLPLHTTPRRPDHDSLRLAKDAQPIEYPKPDGVTTFDLPTSLYRSGGVLQGYWLIGLGC